MSQPIYVIPDIHGYKDKLDHALDLITAEGGPHARIVFLGDLVDRGPDSAGVIQTVMDGMAAGRDWTVIRGNHDQLFIDFLEEARLTAPRLRKPLHWLSDIMGGRDTLASYGVFENPPDWSEVRRSVPQAHIDFLNALPFCLESFDLIFVHAGILPGVPLDQQDPEDLIWIRDAFLADTRDHGKLVVHGHTPVDYPEHHGNRVALDGGAGWGRPLHVAVFEGRECWLLREDGREPLQPL